MAVFSSLREFLDTHTLPQGRILALDVGDTYIGIALSDTGQMIGSPHSLYKRMSFQKDGLHIAHIMAKEQISLMIVGLPLNLDGSIGAQGKKTMTFVEKIESQVQEPIIFWDERFSTQAVEKMMISFDTTRKKRGELIDKLSATYILQGALDFLRMRRG